MNGEYEDIDDEEDDEVKVYLTQDLTWYHPALTEGREGIVIEGDIHKYGYVRVNFSGIEASVPISFIASKESDFVENTKKELGFDKITRIEKEWEKIERERKNGNDGYKFFFSGTLEDEIKAIILHSYKNIVIENSRIIELEQEYKFKKGGRIDFLCKDEEGNYLLIECKGKAKDNAIGQLLRYKTALLRENEIDKKIKLILIAKEGIGTMDDIARDNGILFFTWEKYIHFLSTDTEEKIDKVIYKLISRGLHDDILIEIDTETTEIDFIKDFLKRVDDLKYERNTLLGLKDRVLRTENELNKIIKKVYRLKEKKEKELNEYIQTRKREFEERIEEKLEKEKEKFKQEKLKWRASEFYKIFKMATAANSRIRKREKEIMKSLSKKQTKL